ncbi:nitrate reductase molybdenum cofactor assembly chaperone [Gulosibacter chungangensis]|uniref:Nitrate reductase molybdenum cofactor assembly chaperone n=1 Tax=Gulosibacter chungangensis TaxID=979746 RepID=A0A7J5BC04_9MICO|nr:nitrate reductase molybdenum cofactor assembly chaperone [Gulosibacter chungangensis]
MDTAVPLTEPEVRAVWLAASWLIGYPEDALYERLERMRGLVSELPVAVSGPLLEVIRALSEEDQFQVRSEYVETFDTRRRGCLYLTYFMNGDTRKRGMALLEIKEAYQAAGLEVSDAELPDHLSYVLEFGAAHDLHAALAILLKNRAGIELLRIHLLETGSRWAGALTALCVTLPALDSNDISEVQRLAAEGPEEELVGLAGYGDDGSLDMPPADMSPYRIPPPGAGLGSTVGTTAGTGAGSTSAFIPLNDVKGLQP